MAIRSGPAPDRWLRRAALVAAGYVAVGVTTAALARSTSSAESRTLVRLAAWILSALLFAGHITVERQARLAPRRAAGRTATAVAMATLVLAEVAVVHQLQAARLHAGMLAAFAVWPALTGTVSFLVAVVVFAVLARRDGAAPGASSEGAGT